MRTIARSIVIEAKVKKSIFYAYAYFCPDEQKIKQILSDIKKQHFSSSHVCYAYRLQDKQTFFCEDGEPFGCAGAPILSTIISQNLFYCLVIVVRYFGGIKFGKPLLRSTYKDLAEQILSQTEHKQINIGQQISLIFAYDQIKYVDQIIDRSHGFLVHKRFTQDHVEYVVNLAHQDAMLFLEKAPIKYDIINKNILW